MTNYNVNPNNYSDSNFWNKLAKCATKMGSKLVYYALLLYYVMTAPGTPYDAKMQIVGALAYLIVPTDLIPDFIPLIGFSDDLAAITFVVSTVADHITADIERKAKDKVRDIFDTTDGFDLAS